MANNNSSTEDSKGERNGVIISLSSRGLEEIPKELNLNEKFATCTELYLDYNLILSLPEALPTNLPKLTKLSAIGNDLSSLPDSIGKLSCLKELYLNENSLTELPKSIINLKKLVILQVVGNKLQALPKDFGQLKSLVKIRLDENNLKHLPESFGLMKNVQAVEISHNNLKALPKNFGDLERLRSLDLSNNKLESLPASFSKLPSLTSVDLSENNLKVLPNKFDSCDILIKLYIESNQLECLPIWFTDLSCIMELSLKDNKLHDAALPEDFGTNSQLLKSLNISGNFMTNLPKTIGELKHLHFLHCGSVIDELERKDFQNGNWLRKLPASFGDLKKLTRLHLDENQLIALPENFGDLVSLKFVDICQNRLRELPESFCNLENLEELNLSKNHIENLPSNFGQLENLRDLRLDNNKLEELPKSFSELSELHTLDLFSNSLTELPNVIKQLTNLERLDLDENGFKLNIMDVPQITRKMKYPEKGTSGSGNWRDRPRQDFLQVDIEKVEATEEDLNGERDDDSEIQYNSRLMKEVARKNMSIWRKHSDAGKREVHRTLERDFNHKTNISRNNSSSSTLSTDYGPETPPSDTQQSSLETPEEEDWDKEIAADEPKQGVLRREVPASQFLQSYIYSKYRQQGYKHDFEPSMIHPDRIARTVGQRSVEDGQFDDAED